MTKFETETCGRCGGCGEYSYNQIDGSRCYGCLGTGRRLTKRGHAAKAHFQQLTTMRGADIQAGMLVLDTWRGNKWRHVLSVEPGEGGRIVDGVVIPKIYINLSKYTQGAEAETLLRAVPSVEALHEAMAAALAYEATLTKTGKPRKRAA